MIFLVSDVGTPSSDYYILPTTGRKAYDNPNEFNNPNLNQAKIKIVIKRVTVGDLQVLIKVFPLV